MKRVVPCILALLALLSCGNGSVQLPIGYAYVRAGEDPYIECASIAEAETKMLDYCLREAGDAFDYALFEKAVRAFPEQAMDYGFDQLKERAGIDIFDAADGQVRVYAWNDAGEGGTMGAYGSILQYRWKGTVRFGTFDGEEGLRTCAFYTLGGGKYLRYAYLREWGSRAYAAAEAYGLTPNGLEPEGLFAEEGCECALEVEYNIPDWYFRAGKGEGYKWLFYFDEAQKTLYFPSSRDIEEDTVLSDRYIPYRWDGEALQPLPECGNPFLHPSLQEYVSLARLDRTGRNLIRIDEMEDGTYRYAAWPAEGTMAESPEIVVPGGVYQDDGDVWVFANQGVEYRVTGADLSVWRNGKRQARWEFAD